MTRLSIAWALVAAVVLVGASGAWAQGKKGRVPIRVLVTHLSNHGVGIDPDAKQLDEKLSRQFKYDSLKVLQKRTINLELDEVGEIRLPNGRAARVQPIHKGKDGLLMAVDIEGALKTDARVKNHNQLVIRAGRYEGGDLVISLEPDYQ